MAPSPDILWSVFLVTCGSVVAWAIGQVIAARADQQQLRDHIDECDKRQLWVMATLTLIANKLGVDHVEKR